MVRGGYNSHPDPSTRTKNKQKQKHTQYLMVYCSSVNPHWKCLPLFLDIFLILLPHTTVPIPTSSSQFGPIIFQRSPISHCYPCPTFSLSSPSATKPPYRTLVSPDPHLGEVVPALFCQRRCLVMIVIIGKDFRGPIGTVSWKMRVAKMRLKKITEKTSLR